MVVLLVFSAQKVVHGLFSLLLPPFLGSVKIEIKLTSRRRYQLGAPGKRVPFNVVSPFEFFSVRWGYKRYSHAMSSPVSIRFGSRQNENVFRLLLRTPATMQFGEGVIRHA